MPLRDQSPGTIRRATVDDLDRIRELAVLGWRPIYNQFRLIVGDEMWNALWADWEESWFDLKPDTWDQRIIVTEVDSEVVGFATWWTGDGDLAEVGGNAVDPDYLRRGIGSVQIRWIIDMFREDGYTCAKVHTGLDPSHGPARAEYRNAGFSLGVTNSVYYNYLSEVADVPIKRGLRFRWSQRKDADLVRHLARDSWATVHEDMRKAVGDEILAAAFPKIAEAKADEYARVVTELPRQVRIATEEGQPAGFAVIGEDPSNGLGALRTVAVTPELRERGIGCSLCMDAFSLFREAGLKYARLAAGLGEVNERTRRMCWAAGLHRELPSIDYYMLL
jgi:ribosomal protein S18 acetylase RimI-like enzyme